MKIKIINPFNIVVKKHFRQTFNPASHPSVFSNTQTVMDITLGRNAIS
jgi:hypothetical protein